VRADDLVRSLAVGKLGHAARITARGSTTLWP
jgi:hypothetical protein